MFYSLLTMQINGKKYIKLKLIGEGGSSKVYRVINESNDVLALKCVRLSSDPSNEIHNEDFLNEVSLLKSLRGTPGIIELIDSELNKSENILHIVRFSPLFLRLAARMRRDRPQILLSPLSRDQRIPRHEFHPSCVAANAHRRERDPQQAHHPQRPQTGQFSLRQRPAEANRLRNREIDASRSHQRRSR